MKKVDYTKMSDRELNQYILNHRNDSEAFYTYMDRRHSRPDKISIASDDPDWEAKVISAIRSQLTQND